MDRRFDGVVIFKRPVKIASLFTGRLRRLYSLLGSACMGWWRVFPHMLACGFIKMLLDIRYEVEKILNICEMNGKPCVIRVIEPFSN